jgi:uncharacterized protein (TIGR04562 family)
VLPLVNPVRPFVAHPELYHEIFGSILDRHEMSPYLLRPAINYRMALRQATKMLGNRGFDTLGITRLRPREKARVNIYIRQVRGYFSNWLFPFLQNQLQQLAAAHSSQESLYQKAHQTLTVLDTTLWDRSFTRFIDEDPRHLFLLASLRKYPHLFRGHPGPTPEQAGPWQRMACAILKMAHLIKSLEEDSQEIHQYAQLGLHLDLNHYGLVDLFHFDFTNPAAFPKTDPARVAFVKLSTFFFKLKESLAFDKARHTYVFASGDGVNVDIVDIKARLKSPESMLAKLGKDVEGEVHGLRDILAITFLLKDRHDTLTLFHALQKRGVILQENTISHSITQTLFATPKDMIEAVRRLMRALARSEGRPYQKSEKVLRQNAQQFFRALSINTNQNVHSSTGHRKFQCKLNFSMPIHRLARSHRILIPGTELYADRDEQKLVTEQHTLPVELRISDEQSWDEAEQLGEAHHDAYKFRQLIRFANRLFRPDFSFPEEALEQLRIDQGRLFAKSRIR